MPKRRAKKTVKQPEPQEPQISTQQPQFMDQTVKQSEPKEPRISTHQPQFMDHEIEVERQIAAIRAVRDVEIERLVTELRLLRSHFDKEQLQKPVLQVFEEMFPNLSIVNDEENKKFDVRLKERGSRMSMSCAGGDRRDLHAALLQRLSLSFPECSGRTSFLGDFLSSNNLVLEEPSGSQTLALQEAFQTPGASSQRLSVGMTPKTLRLPKPGEMLLSAHGSPLGVYKENNMEAIHESEEG